MNGSDLPLDHGFPVRAIVPGHYGMASTKWLTSITVLKMPFSGYWQTSDYGYWDYVDGKAVRLALAEMHVKSQISRPALYQTVASNTLCLVEGAAWSGQAEITGVEVSSDGGNTWAEAEFIDAALGYAWQRCCYTWLTPPAAGEYSLLSRAKDSSGQSQPDKHNPNYGSYVINHSLPVEVFVR